MTLPGSKFIDLRTKMCICSFSFAVCKLTCVFHRLAGPPTHALHITTDFLLDCYWKLQVAKGQSATRSPPQSSVSKSTPLASEWNHEPEPPTQQSVASSTAAESSGAEAAEDFSALEDEGEYFLHLLPKSYSILMF